MTVRRKIRLNAEKVQRRIEKIDSRIEKLNIQKGKYVLLLADMDKLTKALGATNEAAAS